MKNIENNKATFWLKEFSDQLQTLILPLDFARPIVKNNKGRRLGFFLGKECTEKLRDIGGGETMPIKTMALYAVLLSKLCCQKDVVIGTFVEGDSFLPLRNKIDENQSFTELLTAIKVRTSPFVEKQSFAGIPTNKMEQNPLVNVLFSYEKKAAPTSLMPSVEITDSETDAFYFDLALSVNEIEDKLFLEFEYATQLFTETTIQRFAEYFKKVVSLVTTNPSTKISAIDIVEMKEKFLVLNKFNRTKAVFPREKTILDLFKEQVDKTPDNIAIVHGQKLLTYRELDQSSCRLANYLLENNSIGIEDLIGIEMDCSEWLILSFLAVLKTGAAYVPIDPSYSKERINYIKESSACKLTIDAELLQRFSAVENDYGTQLPEISVSPSNLAYVIYAMESMYTEEGVMIEHQSLVNLCIWHQTKYQVTEQSKGTLYSGIGSEAFFWEVYPYLISGAGLYLIGENETKKEVKKLHQFLEENAITHACLPVSVCRELAENKLSLNHTCIMTRGDTQDLPKGCNLKICHNYGPLENTSVTTTYDLQKDSDGLIPIGKPINNTSIYIVSDNLRLQPLGVAGELCVAGPGLSRGYLNNEELTKEKFIINPFKENGRLFKTGDLARWLPDGNIQFLGKIDESPFAAQFMEPSTKAIREKKISENKKG